MIKTALYHLFVPSGRTSPKTFWITLAAFALLVVAFQKGLELHDNSSAFYFWGFLIWMIMLISGTYAVYGKRLKDFGRSVWPITGLITFWLVAMLTFGILYGAGDYMAEFSQYERKAVIDEEVKQQLRAQYEDQLSAAPQWVLTTILWGSLGLFTAWVGLSKGDNGENRYGPPPTH